MHTYLRTGPVLNLDPLHGVIACVGEIRTTITAAKQPHSLETLRTRHWCSISSVFTAAKHAAFRMLLSQTRIDYRHSPMSDGVAGDVHGGDRLPWTGDNFDALQSLDWQVHVYGDAPGNLGDVPVHVFPWTEKCEQEGLMKNAAGGQLLYSLVFFVLLFLSDYNRISMDKALKNTKAEAGN